MAISIERLKVTIAEQGLSWRISAVARDMASPEQPPDSFDLIWSEGALYNIGLRDALHICNRLLLPGGHLAFTDAVWCKENPALEIKAGFNLDYPTMGWLDDDLTAIQDCRLELMGHFTMPNGAWWDEFLQATE